MFDTMAIAARIKQTRIKKNMTQMQLADIMSVSYQAVSNWERGNSMPDISKLGDLCGALDLTVNDLLGMEEKTAAAVSKAMQQEELTVEELKEVAPVLPPQDFQAQVDASVRKMMEQPGDADPQMPAQKKRFPVRLVKLSCHGQKAEDAQPRPKKKKVDLSAIAELAPFLDAEYLRQLVMGAELDDLDGLNKIAAYLDSKDISDLMQRCLNEGAGNMIADLAPWADEEDLDNLVELLMAQPTDLCDLDWDVSDLYPYISEKALRKLAKHLLDRRDLDSMDDLKAYL